MNSKRELQKTYPCTVPWADINPFPDRVPLDLEVLSRRTYSGFEEWKIEYSAEAGSGLPDPSVARVPAYLLVPSEELFARPYPAMLCLHQCGRDCDIGKEAVAGKVVDRPDQAYGYELVKQGFLVIAPDSINCGERIITDLRTAGDPPDTWTHANCWDALIPFVPWGTYRAKQTWDAKVSIDVLETLDFVDLDRIGVIGHSMGSGTAEDVMMCDSRIKAGILSSGGCYERERAMLAPRLLIQQQGAYDATPELMMEVEPAQSFIKESYAAAGADPDLVHHLDIQCGHHFHDEFKSFAYAKLRAYFGMQDPTESLSIASCIGSAIVRLENQREDLEWSWPNRTSDRNLPEIQIASDKDCQVAWNEMQLVTAFETLLIPLTQKVPSGSVLNIHLTVDAKEHRVVCRISGFDDVKVAHEFLLREAAMRFADGGAQVLHSTGLDGGECTVDFSQM